MKNDHQALISQKFNDLVLKEVEQTILKVTLNRPTFANAFNTNLAVELLTVFENLSLSKPTYRVVILSGAGQRAFCAGADLKERQGMSDDTWFQQHLIFERMLRAILHCPLPIIGAINGAAYGGGCELVAALDFAYAVDSAKFAQTEVKLGIIPGLGGTQNLARAVGERRAKELILSGRSFGAQEAYEWGLINQVYPVGQLEDAVLVIAKEIAQNAPIAVQQAKQAIQQGLQMSLSNGLAFEISAYHQTISTKDRREGILAFNEKRVPNFVGK